MSYHAWDDPTVGLVPYTCSRVDMLLEAVGAAVEHADDLAEARAGVADALVQAERGIKDVTETFRAEMRKLYREKVGLEGELANAQARRKELEAQVDGLRMGAPA